MPSIRKKHLRLRVFAGPNGSGKSTVIEYVRAYKVKEQQIDFGYYINADEIVKLIEKESYSFQQFGLTTTGKEFQDIAVASGLINKDFPLPIFKKSYKFGLNSIISTNSNLNERLAQIIADFLRKKLLMENKRFSFETVFSHHSKLDIMKEAKEKGYKVYLYFVSTEDPEINKFRVTSRVNQGGHYVDPIKIEDRYYRSLNLLFEACQLAYQVFFFDNSENGRESKMFAHFKVEKGRKKWDDMLDKDIPNWFLTYYSDKVSRP